MVRRKYVWTTILCLSMIMFILSSCGTTQNIGPTNTTANAPTATPASTTVPLQPVPTTAPSTPAAQNTVPPASAKVTLTLNKSSYTPQDKITVTITNGLSSNITTSDHQSSCTIVTLQALEGNTWVNRGTCELGIATRLVTVPAHSSLAQSLSPGAGTFATNATWPRGQYRIVFSYGVGALDAGGSANTPIYSATFVID